MFKPQRRVLKAFGVSLTGIRTAPLNPLTPLVATGQLEGKPDTTGSENIAHEKQQQQLAVMERRLAAVEGLAVRLQQRQGLLESHLSDAEAALGQLRGDLTETRRVLGEGTLERQNVTYLLEQMQRAVQHVQNRLDLARNTHEPAAASHQQKDPRKNEELVRTPGTPKGAEADGKATLTEARVCELMEEALASRMNTTRAAAWSPDPPTAPHLEGDFGLPTRPGVEPRLFDLELRLAALESEKSQRWLEEAAVERLRTAGQPALAELLRGTGALPFQDTTGHTRLASQRVLLYNVPANVGAAEVHELCASAVGGRHGVLSCLVRRLPIPTPATTVVTTDGPARATPAPSPHPSQQKSGARFRSQRASPSVNPMGEKTALKEEPVTLARAFEVTFASAKLAVLAIQQLNGITVRAGTQQQSLCLHVVPVLSAEILAAVQRLEGEGKPLSKKPPVKRGGTEAQEEKRTEES